MSTDTHNDYQREVIRAGDDASEVFKSVSRKATGTFSLAARKGLLNEKGDGVSLPANTQKVEITPQTDGVGTKSDIYAGAFEGLYQAMKNGSLPTEQFEEQAAEIQERQLYDLTAMLVDDLRGGEVPLFMTNVLDVNQITADPEKGLYFIKAYAKALEAIIRDTGIAILAGETAVLGESKHARLMGEWLVFFAARAERIMGNKAMMDMIVSFGSLKGNAREVEKILVDLQLAKAKVDHVLQEILPNLNGSITGLRRPDVKLKEVAPGQVILGLQEIPTFTDIIGPRSNGISLIRKTMTKLLGDSWENLHFEDFVQKMDEKGVWEDNHAHAWLQENGRKLEGKSLWDIATGKTTCFVPMISEMLLGSVDQPPKVVPSTMIHVTGNPQHKLQTPFEGKALKVTIDLDGMPFPPIMGMCQIATNTPDSKAAASWNMGIPYAMVVDANDVETVQSQLAKCGVIVRKVGTVEASESGSLEFSLKTHGVFPDDPATEKSA